MNNTLERKEAHCIFCGRRDYSLYEKEIIRDGEELHVRNKCVSCGRTGFELYNIVYYNTVTEDEYAAGNLGAGLL